MTLEQAIKILNNHKHNEREDWLIGEYYFTGEFATTEGPKGKDFYLSPFEAIAIAEKYERENPTFSDDGESKAGTADQGAPGLPELADYRERYPEFDRTG